MASSQLFQKKALLTAEEKAEAAKLLQQARSNHVTVALEQAKLTHPNVDGIGEVMVERLRKSGINCALKVSYERVREILGIGESKAKALVAWRDTIERQAIRTAPASLPSTETSRIRSKYVNSAQSLDREIAMTRAKTQNQREQMQREFATQRYNLGMEEESTKRHFDVQRNALRIGSDRLSAKLASDQEMLNSERKSVEHDFEVQLKMVNDRFAKEEDRLFAGYTIERSTAIQGRRILDEKFDQIRPDLSLRGLELRKLEREHIFYKSIDMFDYVNLILMPKRSF